MLTVTLLESDGSSYSPNGRHSWPVKFVAEATGGFNSKIFKFHAATPAQPNAGDMFEGVCGLVDYIELPEDEPSEDIKYYRKDEAEIVFRSALEAKTAVNNIWKAVEDLVENWNASRELTEGETRNFSVSA